MPNHERYFIKCDNCGKKIYLGEEVYHFNGYCGLYCSAQCYADVHAHTKTLTFEGASDSMAQVYKEETKQVTVEKTVETPIPFAEVDAIVEAAYKARKAK